VTAVPGPAAQAPASLALQPLACWCPPGPPPLLPRLQAALAAHLLALHGPGCEPLRWAVTAVDPERGLRLEGVVLVPLRPC